MDAVLASLRAVVVLPLLSGNPQGDREACLGRDGGGTRAP